MIIRSGGRRIAPPQEFSEMHLSAHPHKHIIVETANGYTYYLVPSGFVGPERVHIDDVFAGVPVDLIKTDRSQSRWVDVRITSRLTLMIFSAECSENVWHHMPSVTLAVDEIRLGGRFTFGRYGVELKQSDVITRICIPHAY